MEAVVLQKEEFEPTVFLLCAENNMVNTPLFPFNFQNPRPLLSSVRFVTAASPPQALNQARQRINDLILAEHAVKTIKDPFINQLSQADMDDISALQKQLTVSISLQMGGLDQEPFIHLEGLTRDVFAADAELRSVSQSQHSTGKKWSFLKSFLTCFVCLLLIRMMILKVQRGQEKKFKAKMMSEHVQWQFQWDDGSMMPFDLDTNLLLEEALDNKQQQPVKIKIGNKLHHADVTLRRATSADGHKVVELQRKDMKGQ